MGRKRNLRDLTDAMSAGQPVMARRNLWKADHLEGFVVAVDQEWAVLNLIYDVGLNGWSAIRLDTIRDVERQRAEAFITRALAWAGEGPEAVDLDTSSVDQLVRSAATRFPLITIYTEATDLSVCAIGRPQRIDCRQLTFLDISSAAVWATQTRALHLDEVTRIDVGARYETALHHLGGYPPVP